MKVKALLVLVGTALTFASCKKDEMTPAKLIEGKWVVETYELLAQENPGDGSYLVFNACSSSCSGTDYNAGDQTSGTFTYTLNEEGTILTINDQSSNGGSFGATWDVLELSENELRMTASTALGNLKYTFSKQ
jgi:hypothetical protein